MTVDFPLPLGPDRIIKGPIFSMVDNSFEVSLALGARPNARKNYSTF
jgi:hypothetical protein